MHAGDGIFMSNREFLCRTMHFAVEPGFFVSNEFYNLRLSPSVWGAAWFGNGQYSYLCTRCAHQHTKCREISNDHVGHFLITPSRPFFCFLPEVSSGCARPITGQVTSVNKPVIERQKTGSDQQNVAEIIDKTVHHIKAWLKSIHSCVGQYESRY